MQEAILLKPEQLHKCKPETTLFLETKQSLRPAFFFGIIDRKQYLITDENRYAVNLMTPAKIAKHWEMRLYNKTWRLWYGQPSRDQRAEAVWD